MRLRLSLFCSEVSMADLVPVHIRYGGKNSFLSQQLDISPVAPTVMRYWQASYARIVAVFGALCGSNIVIWSRLG